MQKVKYCPQCQSYLPISEFGSNRANKDGLQWCCKECQREYMRKRNRPEKRSGGEKKKISPIQVDPRSLRGKRSVFKCIGFLYGQRIHKPSVYGFYRFQEFTMTELHEKLLSKEGLPSGLILQRSGKEIYVVGSNGHELMNFEKATKELVEIPVFESVSGQLLIGFCC